MRAHRTRYFIVSAAAVACVSCTGTTGYELVRFNAAAQGPQDAQQGQAYSFTSETTDGTFFDVSLTKAFLHVGALYLDQSLPTSGAAEGKCTLPGTYVGEVRTGRDVDMLDPEPQPFPMMGDGSTIQAAVGQVWLSGPDVNDATDQTIVLSVAGTATREADGAAYPFAGDITITQNRVVAPPSSALPGSNPICELRIVTPILTSITLSQNGTLLLQLDPKALFVNVDFSTLKQFSSDPPSFGFTNDDTTQANRNLYANLRAAGAVYRFGWESAGP